MKSFKVISLFVTFIIAGGIAMVLWQEFGSKHIEGIVYDCESAKALEGAAVSLSQKTIFTWDKVHSYFSTTSSSGQFSIQFNIGNVAHVLVTKEGYLRTDEYFEPGVVKIGLLKSSSTDNAFTYSHNCTKQ